MTKTIYRMNLHEVLAITPIGIDSAAISFWGVMRVPGGWIYQLWDSQKQEYVKEVFVPFNNEFQEEVNNDKDSSSQLH